MIEVDWIWGLVGGVVIGCGAAVYLLGNGRIMGASGILGGLIDGSGRSAWAERSAFLAALIIVPALIVLLTGAEATTHLTGNMGLVALAGLLVGLGTRVGNGCTSGHGVCGISRLSPRGMVATVVYIGAGAAMVVLLRAVIGGI